MNKMKLLDLQKSCEQSRDLSNEVVVTDRGSARVTNRSFLTQKRVMSNKNYPLDVTIQMTDQQS